MSLINRQNHALHCLNHGTVFCLFRVIGGISWLLMKVLPKFGDYANFRYLLEFLLVQIRLIVWIAYCLSLVRIMEINIHCQFIL